MSIRYFSFIIFSFLTLCYLATVWMESRFNIALHKEGSIIETASALCWFMAAIFAACMNFHRFKIGFPFVTLTILFGLRELDFHKKFTEIGIFKSTFFFSETVTLEEKLIVSGLYIFILYVVISMISILKKSYDSHNRSFNKGHHCYFVVLLMLIVVKSIDGIGRKMAGFGIVLNQQAAQHFGYIEEILELGAPLFFMFATYAYFKNHKS